MNSINVKFMKDGKCLGYAIGRNEGDWISFPKEQLKFLTEYRNLLGSTMIIIEGHIRLRVEQLMEYKEDRTISINCVALDTEEVKVSTLPDKILLPVSDTMEFETEYLNGVGDELNLSRKGWFFNRESNAEYRKRIEAYLKEVV